MSHTDSTIATSRLRDFSSATLLDSATDPLLTIRPSTGSHTSHQQPSSSGRKTIKVGLLLDGLTTDVWSYAMIQRLIQSPHVSLSVVVTNDTPAPKRNTTLFSKIWNNRYRLPSLTTRWALEHIYNLLIDRNPLRPDANQEANLTPLLADIPRLAVRPTRSQSSDYFNDADINQLKQYDLDVLIRCGFRILRGDILKAARYGIWSLHHGDHSINRGGPAGYWESMESWPEVGTVLQILTEELDGGILLHKSTTMTDPMSVRDTRSSMFWKSASFIPRKIEELAIKGEEAFFQDVRRKNGHPLLYSRRLYKTPTNSELAGLTIAKVLQKTKRLWRNLRFFDQWCLLFDLKDHFSPALWRYKRIVPPKDRFWADPHIIHRGNQYFIFIEEYLYATGKGHISVIVMNEDGSYEAPIKVLERPYHLSYPFVFEHENTLWMIPESMSNGTIDVYRCVDFPAKWEWHATLMENVKAVDATVFPHGGKWWLFANVVENEGASTDDELCLFFSDDVLSNKWTPHPGNPIVSDCKSARPAGRIFELDGTLYRPSQNCSVRYGYGFNLCRIDMLNEFEYKETVVTSVEPKWCRDVVATHTYSRVDRLHMVDALVTRRR
jgi:methionyl-tRNA formyltransferase